MLLSARLYSALSNVLVKPDVQDEACFWLAMARKRCPQANVFDKADEKSQDCLSYAMAGQSTFWIKTVSVSAMRACSHFAERSLFY